MVVITMSGALPIADRGRRLMWTTLFRLHRIRLRSTECSILMFLSQTLTAQRFATIELAFWRVRRSGSRTEKSTISQRKEIGAVINVASVRDFRPSLYVIPYREVERIVSIVPVVKRAHSDLRRDSFDVIQFPIGGTV
jgi:hypothetical protein